MEDYEVFRAFREWPKSRDLTLIPEQTHDSELLHEDLEGDDDDEDGKKIGCCLHMLPTLQLHLQHEYDCAH